MDIVTAKIIGGIKKKEPRTPWLLKKLYFLNFNFEFVESFCIQEHVPENLLQILA